MLSTINISADIGQHDPSWAVISIQGKPDYIEFVDLRGRDIRTISDFLKSFRRSGARVTIDGPYGMGII